MQNILILNEIFFFHFCHLKNIFEKIDMCIIIQLWISWKAPYIDNTIILGCKNLKSIEFQGKKSKEFQNIIQNHDWYNVTRENYIAKIWNLLFTVFIISITFFSTLQFYPFCGHQNQMKENSNINSIVLVDRSIILWYAKKSSSMSYSYKHYNWAQKYNICYILLVFILKIVSIFHHLALHSREGYIAVIYIDVK